MSCPSVAASAALAALALPSYAQAQAAAPSAAASDAALPAVKVTGSTERPAGEIVERRSRSGALFGNADLRDVPFSVNVITAAEIANKQAKTIGEALVGDPAVRNDYGASGAYPTESFNIRGFSINTSGILKDGMPMANQVTQAVENIDQVEVIRGPMGFRYGFVSPGGAINLVSKRPTREPLRTVTFSTDQHGSATGHVDLGGRFGAQGDDERFGYRINGVVGEGKNFVRPIDIHRRLLAGTFDFRATRDTTFTLALDDYRYRAGPDVFHYTVPDVDGNEIRGIPPDRFFGQKFLPDNTIRTRTASVGVESSLSEQLTLSSLFALYDQRRISAITIPVNAQPNGDFNVSASTGGYKDRSLSNTTFLSFTTTAFGAQHSLTAGLSIANEMFFSARNSFNGLLGTPDGLGGITPFVNNFFNPVQAPDTTTPVSGPYDRTSGTRERGVFVSDELRVGDAWRFLLAGRRSSIHSDSIYSPPGSNSSTDPTVGVMVELTPAVSVYASHATGLEQGGVAPEGTQNVNQQLPAQKTRQIELGAKSDLRDGLTLDGALFRIAKAAEFSKDIDGLRYYVQSGRQIHTGGELRLIGRVLSAVTLTTGVQVLHAKLTGDPTTEGQRPQNVPKVNVTFSGDWAQRWLPGLTLTGALYRVGQREIATPNLPAKAGAYTRLDLGTRYVARIGAQQVTARLQVENVTDRSYYNAGWASLYEFGAPRTLSGSVELAF